MNGPDLLSDIDHRRVSRVLSIQGDFPVHQIEPLQGSLIVSDEDGRDLPVFHRLLLSDVNNVTVSDPGVYHGIAPAGEGVVRPDVARKVDMVRDVFLCQDWSPAGDIAYERDLFRFMDT